MKRFRKLLLSLALSLSILLSGSVYAQSVDKELGQHWAELPMVKGYELGWMKGYEDGSLKPDNTITRAEFITFLLNSLEGKENIPTKPSKYVDIDSLAWAKENLAKAEALGMLDVAYPGNELHPSQAISREEAAYLLHYQSLLKRFMDQGLGLEEALEKIDDLNKNFDLNQLTPVNFGDKDNIRPDLLPAIQQLSMEKVISGYPDSTFQPKANLTRAESMVMLLKASNNMPQEAKPAQVQTVSIEGKFYLHDPASGQKLDRSQVKGGRLDLGDQTYILNLDSSLFKGFIEEGNKTLYADEKGLARGWKQVGDKLYYFSPIDKRMYKNGIFSTGEGAYWFGQDGAVRSGKRPGGIRGKMVSWAYPTKEELSNKWLQGQDQALRFRGQEIANFAAKREGVPFQWYGTDLRDPRGVYCCGLTYSAHKEFGIHIPGPNDVDAKKHKGYEMTRAQYQEAEKYGGIRFPLDFNKALPGDLVFNYSKNFYLGFNHTSLYMGKNNGKPIVVHATLQNGIMVEDAYSMNAYMKRSFNKEIVRYNTANHPITVLMPED